jgi:amino-acid N-acetyltransferase
MSPNFSSRPAQAEDEKAIKDFLALNELPFEDIRLETLNDFIVLQSEDKIIGTVGLEICDTDGLLRSLAVTPTHRGQNLGLKLTALITEHAQQQGIRALYLLTTTADSFFANLGYEIIERRAAPDEIQATEEFRRICPDSAVCMKKDIHAA